MGTLRVWCMACTAQTLHDKPAEPTEQPIGREARGVSLRCVACSARGDYALLPRMAEWLLAA